MTHETIKDYYDKNVEEEWNRINEKSTEYQMTCWYLKKYLVKPSSILDIGCGPGKYSLYLAKQGHRVTLLDISSKSIEFALDKAASKGITFEDTVIGDAAELSQYFKKSFDCILCMGPLYHITSDHYREDLITSCYSLLQNGGIFIATFLSDYAKFNNYASKLTHILYKDGFSEVDKKISEIISHINLINSDSNVFHTKTDDTLVDISYCSPTLIKDYIEQHSFYTLEYGPLEGLLDECYGDHSVLLSSNLRDQVLELNNIISKNVSILGTGGHLIYIGQKSI